MSRAQGLRSLRFAAASLVVLLPGWAAAQVPVRVATWNVQTVGAPGELQYDATLQILQRLQPDVIGINEVGSTADVQNLAALAADAGYPYWTVVDVSVGGLRNGILSRLPLLSISYETSASLSGDPAANDISRPILLATVDVPGSVRDLTLAVEHWKSGTTNADELRRAIESIRIAQALAGLDPGADAYVALGDVNEEADSVPNAPALFTALPTGLPLSFSLGADLQAVLSSTGIANDPFQYLAATPSPALSPLPALQADGSDATRLASGRRLDYISASPALLPGAQAEVYDAADEGLAGLPKYGAPLPASVSLEASDHLPVFADLLLPTSGCTLDAECQDGIFCNGVEVCSAGTCLGGAPETCDDGVSCTVDTCDEGAQACLHTADHAACDDGLFCTGAEVCDVALDCQPGPAPCAGQACSEATASCVAPTASGVWINELHYDNTSTDFLEGVEVAGPAGTDLTGFQLVFYNGLDGAPYRTELLSGVLPDQGWGVGTRWVAVPGVQNGSPDAVALVDAQGAVVEFIAYEGDLTASAGPAAGMTALDIGVAEDNATPVGSSLQRQGTGDAGSAFVWAGPLPATLGEVNLGQTFARPCATDLECANGVFCDGAEVCVSGLCELAAPVVCDDNLACTSDVCDEGVGACVNTPDPQCDVQPWINELHYDNAGTDVNEGVEIAGPAGVDLTGWTVVAYNGSVGTAYATVALSGAIPDQHAGWGAVFVPVVGLQNGAPDGVALVDAEGAVVELLSYEGAFTALDGPAAGMFSKDIEVFETSSAPATDSLQRVGVAPGAFTWTTAPQSRGLINAGQL
jgi:endonuclease/exonuclease/phosphatase family metal-dependent hydrolase